MSERAEKLYDGITGISDRIVERAGAYVFQKKRRRYSGLTIMGTMAACACLMVVIVLPYLASGGSSSDNSSGTSMWEGATEAETAGKPEAPAQTVLDTESTKDFTADSAVPESSVDMVFGSLFPEMILAGYEPEEGATIYEGVVLQARYYHETLQDEMTIRIAHSDWFVEELGEVETDVIFYREKAEKTASYIYMANGEYIVEYSFSSRDIAEIDGFYEMVYSAPCFTEE
ncbi:MAG: hypothetical protein IJZ82_09980 [Lachnospiraceae bacterium]|nr:hypothetical protein [Lachnospiraceae bacterium]